MAKLELENEEIKRKKQLLKDAEIKLKEDFIGIDSVIEQTLYNMRPWYLYPELQEKPLVISLVGLTGTGKTSLVKELVQLLDIEKDMVYFNFAEINDMKPWEVEDTIDEQLSNEKSNRIFVYDEFQYAATLDSGGGEKDNRSGLKPFWELMDSGLIHKGAQYYEIHTIKNLLNYAVRMCEHEKVELENGVWINATDCLAGMPKYDVEKFSGYFNFDVVYDEKGFVNKSKPASLENKPSTMENGREENSYTEEYDTPYADDSDYYYDGRGNRCSQGRTFLKEQYITTMYNHYTRFNPNVDMIEFYHKITKMCFDELMEFLNDMLKVVSKGYDLKFNDSIIFVLMNLDEAYNMSFDVDPDMLPDQFHKITKKLTIVDMKEALKHRFRNEQIARFGNIFMIYPSFSSESFRKLIDLFLENYAKKVKERWGINIVCDDSLKNIIYKDAVFPTQGTRPIISSIHEIVKTKFPIIVDKVSAAGITEADTFRLSYDSEKIVANICLSGKNVAQYEIPQELRLEKHRNNEDPEQQARVAVHESGHFVIYANLMGKVPEKLVSNAISKDNNGFLLMDDDDNEMWTKEEILTNIKIALGGYVAEELVFGQKKRGAGANNDLLKATTYASQMVREYGMGSKPYVTTYLKTEMKTSGGMKLNPYSQQTINDEITKIIDACLDSVKHIFADESWRKMLKDSATYLSKHSSMSKEKMQKLYNRIPKDKKNKIDKKYYRNSLKNFK
jgi:cell division protease FtsH